MIESCCDAEYVEDETEVVLLFVEEVGLKVLGEEGFVAPETEETAVYVVV